MRSLNTPKDLTCIEKFKDSKEHATKVLGSGDVDVLSTPFMILFMGYTA